MANKTSGEPCRARIRTGDHCGRPAGHAGKHAGPCVETPVAERPDTVELLQRIRDLESTAAQQKDLLDIEHRLRKDLYAELTVRGKEIDGLTHLMHRGMNVSGHLVQALGLCYNIASPTHDGLIVNIDHKIARHKKDRERRIKGKTKVKS